MTIRIGNRLGPSRWRGSNKPSKACLQMKEGSSREATQRACSGSNRSDVARGARGTMADLRQNRVKRKLREGKPAIVVPVSTSHAVERLGTLGVVDGIWVEMEHGPVT